MGGWTVVDQVARETGFSGVARIDDDAAAYGFADRAHRIAMTPATRLAMASGSKGFTALVVMGLVEDGVLSLDTPARAVLGG
jgi:CubicO group peptidase (beta-lactamase class C family)